MTSIDGARPGIATALGAAVALAWCTAAGIALSDPILAVEVAAGALLVAWAVTLLADMRRSVLLGRALDLRGRPSTLHDVAVRIIPGTNVEAFAVGLLRPRVYLSEAALGVLDSDELAAVVHHEEHHRRTLAPLRAAAVEAWLRLLGRSHIATSLLSARLVQFEAAADAYAIARGVHPSSIAAALLKVEARRTQGAAFAGSADQRVRALIDVTSGRREARMTPLPYEWLPVAVTAAIAIGCHVGGFLGAP